MKALLDNVDTRTERVFLVGVELKSSPSWDVRDSMDELTELVATAGGEVAGCGTQKLDKPNTATFIGPGKADKFADFCRETRWTR